MERRKGEQSRSSPLPADYINMVSEIFTSNFDAGMKELRLLVKGDLSFESTGAIYADEIVLSVSLLEKDKIAATTVYASSDFDPKASSPTIQDLLSVCVDAIGTIFSQLLDPDKKERLEQIAGDSLSAMDNIPFYWTEVKMDRYRIHLKVDKTNPKLEELADEWLTKNDPSARLLHDDEHKATEKLFVTGPSGKTPRGSGSGGLH